MIARIRLQRMLVLASLLVALPVWVQASAASGKRLIKCWYDDRGIRECGSNVPPEYVRNRIEVINEHGVVVQIIEATRTKEEQERERERERLRREKEAKIAEQRRKDEILLSTYTSEKELLTSRDNNLHGLKSQMDILKNNLQAYENILENLNRQAADIERSGNKPPQKLVDEIHRTREEITLRQAALQIKEDEKTALIKRYDDDLKRFRELKRKSLFN